MSNRSDIHEPRVSATYREIATETTPAHLDRRVLEAARTGARTRYGLARAWMRPLAWAATIALSFAFVLQVAQQDDALLPIESVAPNEHADAIPGGAGDAADLREAPGDAIIKAKEFDNRAVLQAPARLVPEPSPVMADEPRAVAAPVPESASCDAGARADPGRWYACIEALREAGRDEAADAELEALRAEFPGFRVPVAN